MANRNFASGGKIYSMHVMPVQVDMNFAVDSSDPTGVSSLKGPLVANVFMASGSPSDDNPNPANGTIVVQLQDNYNKVFAIRTKIQSPSSGSDVKIDNSALTAGVAYTISIVGNASEAHWHAIGVPAGITPAVGVSFIALTDGGTGNVKTSRVQASAAAGSGIASIEVMPDMQADLAPSKLLQSTGSQIILQCRDYAGALAAPADGSVIMIELYLSNSSVTVQGE